MNVLRWTNRPLGRRALLRDAARGGAVAIALPFLEAMRPRRAHAAVAPPRFVAFLKPNGLAARRAHRFGPPSYVDPWTPPNTGPGWRMTPLLQPLAALRNDVTIVSGVHEVTFPFGPMDHCGNAIALVPFFPINTAPGEYDAGGRSMDQAIADKIGTTNRFKSLELGAYLIGDLKRNLSYAGARMPNPPEQNPARVFMRLFANGVDNTQVLERLRVERRSVLDTVKANADLVRKRLGRGDQIRLDGFLTSIREIENELNSPAFMPGATCGKPALEALPNFTSAELLPKVMDQQTKLLTMALACDLTRVVTFMLQGGGADTPYPFIGVNTGHHAVTHSQGPDPQGDGDKIDLYQMGLFANILTSLKNTLDVESNLLENTTVLLTSDVPSGWHHLNGGWTWGGQQVDNVTWGGTKDTLKDLAFVIAGNHKAFKHGSHLRYVCTPSQYSTMEQMLRALYEAVTGVTGDASRAWMRADYNLPPLPGLRGENTAALINRP